MARQKSLKQFAIDMTKLGRAVPDRADKVVRQLALAADRALVQATPVDTGRARANWQASLGSPAVGVVGSPAPRGTRAFPDPSGANAAVIAGYKGGDSIFLTNNLPYIEALNNGHSKQAPENFVETAIARVETAARRARLIY